jgi:hypothetical protein
MNEPQSIDDVILEAINEGWFLRSHGDYPNGFTGSDVRNIQNKAKAAIEAMVREIIGDNLPTFGPQNEAGDISEDDYFAAGYNDAKCEQRLRASKYNLKLEKE